MIDVCGVSVAYPDGVRALSDVSFRVARGEVLGLLGPNGAGKSTLLRVIATLQRPDAGTVRIGGDDVTVAPELVRGRLGYLPQDFGFPAALTPAELLAHFAVLRGIAPASARHDAVANMLQRVNLERERDRPVRSLSGGMKQRLGLAVALLGAPDVLVVDEPTAALDPSERHRIHDLLLELADERAILFSTHLVADVDALCHSAIVLHRGRVVRSGAPQVLTATLHGRLFSARLMRTDARVVRDECRVIREFLVHGAVEMRVIADVAPDARFSQAEPTLDDVFAEATAP